MGGKSRKSGGISAKLIARIKSGAFTSGKSKTKATTTNEKTTQSRRTLLETSRKAKS